MIVKSSADTTAAVPPGTYKAVITGVFDLGTQPGHAFNPGEEAKPRRQLVLQFELHKGNETFLSHKFYTCSFHPKASLRKDVEALDGKVYPDVYEYDLATLLGRTCRVAVVGNVVNGREREKITTIMPLDGDEAAPKPGRTLTSLDLDVPGFKVDPAIPTWITTRAGASPEYQRNFRFDGAGQKSNNESKFNGMIS